MQEGDPKTNPKTLSESIKTNENSRRLSFHAHNSRDLEDSINKEIEIFQSDAPKNKAEVNYTVFFLYC